MVVDLVIKNGKIVTPIGIYDAGVAVDGGTIVAIAKEQKLPKADTVVDAKENFVLPGVIDAHVHFREPGLTNEEDYTSGSTAAAIGGVTMVNDMPCTIGPRQPLTIDVARLKEKLAIVERKSFIDFGLYALVISENLDKLSSLANAGVMGFKLFLGVSVGKIPILDDGTLLDAFKVTAETGLPLLVHAENEGIISHIANKFIKDGRTDPLAFVDSRPTIAEAESIQKAILFCEESRNRLHICHMSTKKGVESVKSAKNRGLNVTAETCPHLLLLGRKDVPKIGAVIKMNPPVRSAEDIEGLWKGLREGTIDIITSDHSPVSPEEKLTNIWEARAGFPQVEISVPLLLTEINKGMLSLNRYVELTSKKPAAVFGLYPKKGAIQVGSDGDFTIVDLKKEGVVRSENLHSKAKLTPFDGARVKGMPIYTIVRGNVVMEMGEILGKPCGRWVKPRIPTQRS